MKKVKNIVKNRVKKYIPDLEDFLNNKYYLNDLESKENEHIFNSNNLSKFIATGTSFFLTYSNNNLEKEEFVDKIKAIFEELFDNKEINYIISRERFKLIAQEKKSIRHHYHIFLDLRSSVKITPKMFSFFGYENVNIFPNISAIKSKERAILYALKEDVDPIFSKKFRSYLIRKRFYVAITAFYRIKKRPISVIVKDYPLFGSNHIVKLKNIALHYNEAKNDYRNTLKVFLKKKELLYFFRKIDEQDNKFFSFNKNNYLFNKKGNLNKDLKTTLNKQLQILKYFFLDMYLFKYNRYFKSKQLLLYSNMPNKGKSTLIRIFSIFFKIFRYPVDKWFGGYKDNYFDFIYWNEVSLKGLNIEDIHQFLEGSELRLPVKGSHIYKSDNPLIIMTSNRTLEHMVNTKFKYDNKLRETYLHTLNARIEQIDVSNNILFLLIFRLAYSKNIFINIKQNRELENHLRKKIKKENPIFFYLENGHRIYMDDERYTSILSGKLEIPQEEMEGW